MTNDQQNRGDYLSIWLLINWNSGLFKPPSQIPLKLGHTWAEIPQDRPLQLQLVKLLETVMIKDF